VDRPVPEGGGVTFREPIMLAGLLLLPLAALAYFAMQRRRRREAGRFANPALLPNLVTARPGWRRHLPPLLILLALTALVVALARPQRTVAAPQRAATVMMVTDVSGSMNATDVQPDRLTAAIAAARRLTDALPENFRLGLVTFADFAEVQAPPTTDRDAVRAALDRLQAVGGTAMAVGLQRALDIARAPVPDERGNGSRRLPAVLVLLSDGKDTQSSISPLDVAQQARSLRVPVYAIALGTPSGEVEVQGQFGLPQRIRVPPDTETLREIARTTGGRYFAAPDAARLETIYSRLGTRLSSRPEQREVTAAFAGGALLLVLAGGALLLLLAGGALSLSWFGRPL
jgi:Ca-activated chloride channel family protein